MFKNKLEDTSNIEMELKGFLVIHNKPMAFDMTNRLFPVVYKERIIRNSELKVLERHMAGDIQWIQVNGSDLIGVGVNRVMIY